MGSHQLALSAPCWTLVAAKKKELITPAEYIGTTEKLEKLSAKKGRREKYVLGRTFPAFQDILGAVTRS